MDNSGRVGDITSSTSISTSNSGDSSGSKTSNVGAGRGAVGSISSSIRISSISGIAKTSISKTSIRITSISMSSIAKTSISISSIKESRVSLSISLGFTLGDMDNTGRVGNITSSTGISSGYGRDSSGSKTSDVSAGRGAVGSISSKAKTISKSSIAITGIAKTMTSIAIA